MQDAHRDIALRYAPSVYPFRLTATAMNKPFCFAKVPQYLLLMTMLFSGVARAEWIQFGRTTEFRIYLDQRLISKNGDYAQMWQLMDFTVAQWADAQTAVGSIKTLVEYDCAQPRSRALAGEAYTEQMGAGRLVSREQVAEPQWEGVEAGSTPEKMRQVACGKKP